MPHEVVMAMRLRSNEVIADIGAGTGYFSRRFANHARRVVAVDIESSLLEVAAKNAPVNHETLLAAPDDPRLPAGSVDTVFFCDVIHHIHDRNRYYPKVVGALKPGGRIVVIDFHRRPTPVGPPVEMKLSEEQMIAEWKAAGMKLVRTETFLPHQYFLFFERQ